jgi:hypothetical protein
MEKIKDILISTIFATFFGLSVWGLVIVCVALISTL